VQQLSVSLDGRDHAGHDVVATQEASDFRLDAGPGAVSELSQQAPVKAGMQSQPFGNRQHDLPVRNWRGDFVRHVQRGQQSAFLMARGTRTALLAGIGHEHLVVAVGAPNSDKAFFQIATLEKGTPRCGRRRVARSRTWPESARHTLAERSQNADPSVATGRRSGDRVGGTAATVGGRQ